MIKAVRHLLAGLLAGYVVLVLILFIYQRDLLYYPKKMVSSEERLTKKGLRFWPSVEDYRGFSSIHEPDQVKGTIVVFHGNASTAYHRRYYTAALHQHGYRIILAEYPGYGSREGELSETTLVNDALETVRQVYAEYQEPIFLLGESLGSAVVASTVAKTDIPIKGLILLAPWDTLADLAFTHYGYLMQPWLMRDKYDSLSNLTDVDGRVAVILAGKDEIIPIKHDQRLYDSLQGDKKFWLFKDAGHNTMPIDPSLSWWKEVVDFVSE